MLVIVRFADDAGQSVDPDLSR